VLRVARRYLVTSARTIVMVRPDEGAKAEGDEAEGDDDDGVDDGEEEAA
jgi:hypothetical protein